VALPRAGPDADTPTADTRTDWLHCCSLLHAPRSLHACRAECPLRPASSPCTVHVSQVLPLYIVVMLSHGNPQPLVAENLDAFLNVNAIGFAAWCAIGS